MGRHRRQRQALAALISVLAAVGIVVPGGWVDATAIGHTPPATSVPGGPGSGPVGPPGNRNSALVLAGPRKLSIAVAGAQFVNQDGLIIQLRGVNRPGTEYRCVSSDPGFITSQVDSDGRTLGYADMAVQSILRWNKPGAFTNAVNAVRIPLNEDCWLGINGVPAAYGGINYQAFIEREVADLAANDMYAILDLHWSAPATSLADGQDVAPDADHSVTFWQQVAAAFKDTPSAMFDLFNEPRIDVGRGVAANWWCYLHGCSYTYGADDNIPARTGTTFEVAGMQQLIMTIRAAGAGNVIIVEGLAWANDLWRWVTPGDPAHQLAAELHVYPTSGQTTPSALTAMLASSGRVAGHMPVYVGEFGEQGCSGASSGFAASIIGWANAAGYSYTAWGWDAGEGCDGPSLVTGDDSGTADAYGSIVRHQLQARES